MDEELLWWPKDNSAAMETLATAIERYGSNELLELWYTTSTYKPGLVAAFTDPDKPRALSGVVLAAADYADYAQQHLGSAAAIRYAGKFLHDYSKVLETTFKTVTAQRDALVTARTQSDRNNVLALNRQTQVNFWREIGPFVFGLSDIKQGLTGSLMARPNLGEGAGKPASSYLNPNDVRATAQLYWDLRGDIDFALSVQKNGYLVGKMTPQEPMMKGQYDEMMNKLVSRGYEAAYQFGRLASVLRDVAFIWETTDKNLQHAFATADKNVPPGP